VENLIREITDILKREVKSLTAIRELLILEERSLIECDTESLIQVLEKQGDLLSSMACLEKSRLETIRKISDILGEDASEITVSRLSRLTNSDSKNELLESAHLLEDINREIKRKKSSNNVLVRQALMLVENDIRVIMKAMGKNSDAPGIYSPLKSKNKSNGSVRIDQKI